MSDYRHITGTVVPFPEDAVLPEHHLPWCFGCGPENDHALGVRFSRAGDAVVADLEFASWFQGGPGVVHGGAVAAFFDDLMGAVLMAHLRPAVTAKLEVNYLRPIPLGITLRGRAWLARREGRKMWVESVGEDGEGRRYVEAAALMIPIDLDHFARAVEHVAAERREARAAYQEGEYYP